MKTIEVDDTELSQWHKRLGGKKLVSGKDLRSGNPLVASESKRFVLRQVGSKWCLFSRKTGKKLGCHATKGEAEAQERAIQRAKHMRKGHEDND